MNPTTIALLKEYEVLMLDKRELEDKLEGIKLDLLPIIPREHPIETEGGIFTVESRTKWVYTPATAQAEKNLKLRKKEEEQTGVATGEDGPAFLVYREKKS